MFDHVLYFDFRNSDLIDRKPVIALGHVEVYDSGLCPDRAVLAAKLDRDPVDQHPVHRAVAFHE